MKKLSKIKLNQFSKDELDRRKMNALRGGCSCTEITACQCTCSSPSGTHPSSSTDSYDRLNMGGTEYISAY